jgi:hypothetical protein
MALRLITRLVGSHDDVTTHELPHMRVVGAQCMRYGSSELNANRDPFTGVVTGSARTGAKDEQ